MAVSPPIDFLCFLKNCFLQTNDPTLSMRKGNKYWFSCGVRLDAAVEVRICSQFRSLEIVPVQATKLYVVVEV
jgi:hypothetical protein